MEKEFLTLIQKGFPVKKRPFLAIANMLGAKEDDIIDLYKDLKERGIIRQTSAIFDTKSLGYKSSLVAFKANDIQKAASIVNTHPGVSHNYERDNTYNLWFTIAVAPDSRLGLQKSVRLLAEMSGVKEYIILPTKKMFKISVQLDLKGDRLKKEEQKRVKRVPMELQPIHFKMIKLLQKDISAKKEPFGEVVDLLKIDYKMLEDELARMKAAGIMRRFASILYHRKAGFKANAMVVWKVDEDKEEEVAKSIASYSAVSHCYLRPVYPSWPYSLFSMVHGRCKEEVEEVVLQMSKDVGIYEYSYLYSTREFKKVRINYFSDSFKEWEDNHIG